MAIIKDGKILKLSTYGKANFDWNIDVDVHINFQIASTNKLLATTLIMKSIYNGKLSLEDEVGKFIENSPKAWSGLKLKYLLNHTSGIKSFRQNKNATTEEVVSALKDSTLAYPYGTKQAYVSGDFTILINIIEKIYHKSYPEVIKQEITVPLGMNDGAFDKERIVSEWTETDLVSRKASTYYIKDGKKIPYKFFYPQYAYGAGGYYASISDMANWAINMDKGTLFPNAFENQTAYSAGSADSSFSGFSKIGWSIGTSNKIRFGGHSGGPALGDVLRFPDQKTTVIVLSNDGELLPYFAPALATFYVKGFQFKRAVSKFRRIKALQ